MIGSLNTAITGLKEFQKRMDVIGNNIANVNTTAYKAERAEFADTFSQTLRAAGTSPSGSSTAALQIGTGTKVTSINSLFTQGGVVSTGLETHMAINGEGFFVVRDAANDSQFVTRAGDFHLDKEGYLITDSGYRVQGYNSDTLNTIGDLRIDATNSQGASATQEVRSYAIGEDGQIRVLLADDTQFVRGQVLLQNFKDPQTLTKEGDNLYSNLEAAGPTTWTTTDPKTGIPGKGVGSIQSGHLEQSNVDLATEFTNLITTQRGYQSNARIISTSDEMLQELVNLKR